MSLTEVQNQFQHYLTEGDIAPVMPEITDDARLGATKRLAVYFDAYRLRLLDIMKLDFEKTHTLLGDDAFEEAIFAYLKAYPSTHFSVRYFGQHFPKFLAEQAPFSAHPVLTEMATFEWMVSHTLDAADATELTQSDLAQLTPEAWPLLQLDLHPSVISHCFTYDTPTLFQDIEMGNDPRMAQLQPEPIRWVLNRKALKSLYRSCTPVENVIFEAILAKANFSEICEALIDHLEEADIPMTAAQTIFNWVNDGFFIQN